ncbi:glycosyltransferase [Variovorax sp. KBW07]|uniref:glycosyltransferase n=1 Tax=Variovorax sp. KBW07 TaxID=2153358 RepID=UPI000F5781AF|nr:glycosyltransferase [Variovorax sp. KBW07]RQO59416.1 glycosyltransferase [Variovorax sp. KBW07]
MYKTTFGTQRQQLLDWLRATWLRDGPPICIVEGFPGVGKTALAGDLCDAAKTVDHLQICFEEVTNRPAPSLTDLFLDLASNLTGHCNQPDMETALLGEGDLIFARALDRALRNDVLIVIDDFQRLLKPDSGEPMDELANVLQSIGMNRGHKGRLLLLSDRLLVQGRWSADIPVKRLNELAPAEAIALLEDRLASATITDAVSEERKLDLVKVLGCNPRAIETLVASLAFDSLDDVVGRHPGFWSVLDRDMSREFLIRLERDLLERSIAQLNPDHYRRLLLLSVHRKNFEQGVFQLLYDGKRAESRALAHALVTHFLLNHVGGWYSVQPLVREIGLTHLREHDADFKQAHARAAEYYVRPLKARDASGFNSRLVNSFAEARYHLYHAGKNEELRELVVQMIDVARAELNATSPVPNHPEDLNERIGILSILLERSAPGGLHYYIARCLRARKGPGDLKKAVEHARAATAGRRAPADAWVLLAQLLEQTGDKIGAIETIYKALDAVPDQDKRFALYHYGATLFASAGKIPDALILLQEGILNVPPEKSATPLYMKAAELYAETNREDTAIALLRDAVQRVPAKQDAFALYRMLVQALVKTGRTPEAKDLLTKAIAEGAVEGPSLDQVQRLLRAISRGSRGVNIPESEAPAEPTTVVPASVVAASNPSKRILVMATEWTAKHGGLSTFNRELCKSLSSLGHDVVCVVPRIEAGEANAALAVNVRLVGARPGGQDPASGLLRRLPLQGFAPDLIIGHGRITGEAARVQQQDSYPTAKRIHFVHMAPGEIEWYKGKEDAAQTADHREGLELDLCKEADLVAAVGPRLYLEVGNLLSALQVQPRLFQFIPGLRGVAEREPSPLLLCLVLGRAEDIQLKGLDIAAKALAKLLESGSEFDSTPELVVRGAPTGTGTALREALRDLVYPSDLSIRVKEYSSDIDAIEQDLRRASVLLMPSRREGFGLVPLEALQAGTPILVSNKSGFAEFLKSKISSSNQLQQYVVRTVDDVDESATEWAKALEFVLRDRKAAFRRTVELQDIFTDHTWDTASKSMLAVVFGS